MFKIAKTKIAVFNLKKVIWFDNTFLTQFCQGGDCVSNTTLTKPCE